MVAFLFATPVFDGAREAEIRHLLGVGGLRMPVRSPVSDGRSGDKFEQPVTVGYIYMLKLPYAPWVDDKIHARSIGPYSLITQQPLGGAAQLGGQRLREMGSVGARSVRSGAHFAGAASFGSPTTCMVARKFYEAIVKGEPGIEPECPNPSTLGPRVAVPVPPTSTS